MKIRYAFVCGLALASAAAALAVPQNVTSFVGSDFASFGANSVAGALITSNYNYNNTFTGTFASQAFSLSSGEYLYLYQAENSGKSVLEVFGFSEVYNPSQFGYLNANSPIGFLTGGKLPVQSVTEGYTITYDAEAGGFYSCKYTDHLTYVLAGEHTVTYYVVSKGAPVAGRMFAIDHGTADAVAWAPGVPGSPTTPEPSALLGLLAAAGPLAVIARRRK